MVKMLLHSVSNILPNSNLLPNPRSKILMILAEKSQHLENLDHLENTQYLNIQISRKNHFNLMCIQTKEKMFPFPYHNV